MDQRFRTTLNALTLRRNLSHAVQSPIASLLNLTELVLSGVDGDVNDAVRQDVRQMVDDVRRVEGVLAKFLELCTVDLTEPELRSMNVSVPIDAALKAAEAHLHRFKKRYHRSIADDLPWVKANAALMVALLGRLISLVAEVAEAECISVQALSDQTYVTVCVGAGDELPVPTLTHFVELPQRWYRDELALDWLICHRLAECQGSTLWISHQSGGGFTVNVSLPVSL